jgi:hypothetical protein
VTGSCECDKPLGSGATELVNGKWGGRAVKLFYLKVLKKTVDFVRCNRSF